MTAPFDFRRTFLHAHLAQQLSPPSEVLALEELNKVAGAAPLTLHDFFYGGLPEGGRLYLPVRVLPLGDEVRGLPSRYFSELLPHGGWPTFDLTYALAALRHYRIPGGIYLRSRSGAGKTVAGLAALCDCFFGPGPQGVRTHTGPRLAGYLPCRLRPGAVFKPVLDNLRRFKSAEARQSWLDEEARQAGSALVEDLLQATAGLAGTGHAARLGGWLRAGPPLLLFVDLNALGEVERRLTAAALVKFQDEAAPAGHRVVVTYRSATLDAVHNTLSGCPLLHPFDLEPLATGQATDYLRNYRLVAAERQGKPCALSELDAETETLRRLIDSYGTADDSLVSTPLLMHLVTLISGEELRQVQTLTDLYDRVVRRVFERDFRRTLTGEVPRLFADRSAGSPEGHFVTALCRVALAILAGGANNTRLTGSGPTTAADVLHLLWDCPEVGQLWDGGPTWHPAADWWLQRSPYYGAEAVAFDEGHRRALFQRTLLHEDGDGFRFLHDSFLYYFAAVAVRGYRHAGWNSARNQLTGDAHPWYEQTAARLHEAPRAWAYPAEFLGGMLRPREMSNLAFHVLIAAPREGWPGVLIRLLGGRRRGEPEDPVVEGIDHALHHKEGMVERHEAALRTEVYHYLRDGAGDAACRAFAERLERAGGYAWLYSVKPTWWPAPVLRAHRGIVTCVALLPDGRVVSGSEDGQVFLWDPVRRRVQTLNQHEKMVTCLAVTADGSTVVSGGHDEAVRRWTRAGGADATPLVAHAGSVLAVAVSGDGGTVVSGGRDNAVRRWTRAGGADPEPLLTHANCSGLNWVDVVALSADGDTVVSGGHDDAVRRWTRVGGADPEPLLTHRGGVSAVVLSADGNTVVSGGWDNAVRRWTLAGGADPEPLLTHAGSVLAVALSDDGGTVVSGGDDGTVRRWTVANGADPEPLLTHDDRVLAVAVSGDGGTAVSGGSTVVRRWTLAGGADPEPLLTHDHYVDAVAVSGDGGTVISGGHDRVVRRWTRAGVPKPLLGHRGGVLAVALSGDGGAVVSGGDDGAVRRWAGAGSADPAPLLTHGDRVRAVALSGDGGTVVSGGEDGAVRRWTRAGGAEPAPLLRHDESVHAVALSGDGGTAVSGGDDRTVRCWTRTGGADPAPLLTHGNRVRAVALSGDGGAVVSGGHDGAVRRWTLAGGADPEPLLTHGSHWVVAVALSGDGGIVVSGDEGVVRRGGTVAWVGEGTVRRWTLAGGADPEPLLAHRGGVLAVALSSDGGTVVSGGNDRAVRRWTQAGGADPAPLLTHDVVAVALSGDGRTVVSGGEDWTLRCWRDGHGVVCSFFFNSPVRCLAFAGAVGRIAVGLRNGEVLILDLRNPPPDPPTSAAVPRKMPVPPA